MHLPPPSSATGDRPAVREELLRIVRTLHKQQGHSLRNIATELLVVASAAIASPPRPPDTSFIETVIPDDDPSLQYDDDDAAPLEIDDSPREAPAANLIHVVSRATYNFLQTEVAQSVAALHEEMRHCYDHRQEEQNIRIKEQIVSRLVEHAETWKSLHGTADDYENQFPWLATALMRSYVVRGNRKAFDSLTSKARQLADILGPERFDFEIFLHDTSRFREDLSTFKTILTFLKANPDFRQKDLYKALAINGPRCSYILKWADELKILSRRRYKDTWILNVS